MCGFAGFCNISKNISSKENIYKMNNALSKRGPDEEGYYYEEHICLGHKRLIVIDPDGGKQPMTNSYSENTILGALNEGNLNINYLDGNEFTLNDIKEHTYNISITNTGNESLYYSISIDRNPHAGHPRRCCSKCQALSLPAPGTHGRYS